MLCLFRQHVHFRRRVALGVAFVLFFLVTIGEALHYKHHERVVGATSVTQALSGNAELGTGHLATPQTKDYCALCEWEAVPSTGAVSVVTFLLPVLLPLLFAGFREKPLFSVRLTLALRESRGPPALLT